MSTLFKLLRLLRNPFSPFTKRLGKYRVPVDIGIGLFIGAFIIFGIINFLNPKGAEAAWFDDSYSYRQRVDLTITSSATDISNLQTLLTINTSALVTAGKLQSDCDDLRFTNTNGKQLPYYIDSGCNTTTTKVWVMADLVPKSTAVYVFYMYYGNPSVAAGSNSGRFDNLVGLKGYWTMNETSGTAVADSSITANNGTASGATIASGQANFGNTRSFTAASSHYIGSIADNDAYTIGSGDFTMSAWVNFTTTSGIQAIMAHDNGGGTTDKWIFWYNGGNLGFHFNGTVPGSQSPLSTAWSPSTGTWYHIAITKSGSSYVSYVNGAQLGTGTNATAIPNPTVALEIGRAEGGNYFNGSIDDVKFHNSARTAAQIASDYANTSCGGLTCTITNTVPATITPSTAFASEEKAPSPIAYWKFDEGQGVVAQNSQYKSSGTTTNLVINPSFETGVSDWQNAGNTTLSQSSTYSAIGSYSMKSVSGASGNANAQKSTNPAVTAGTTYTYSAYVRSPDDVGQTAYVWIYWFNGGVNTGETTGSVTLSDSWQRITASGAAPATTTSARIHVLWTATAGSKNMYIDGVQFEAASAVTNYCDGSLTGNGTRSWSGTAHASTSTCSNGTDGMISGTTWQTEDQSISGKSLYFDGANGFVQVADNPSLNITGDMTLSAWVRTPGDNLDSPVIVKDFYTAANNNGGYMLWVLTDGRVNADFRNNTVNNPNSTGTVIDNKWHHIAAVYDDAGTIKIYIDGVLDTTDSSGVPASLNTTTNPLTIGTLYRDTGYDFKGTIDEPKIYNFALSAEQIKAQYTAKAGNEGGSVLGATNQNLSNGLVGYWKMDETAAGSTADSSGNSNNGTDTGTTVAAGKFGNSRSFNGTTDKINNTSQSGMPSGASARTLSVWVKTSADFSGFAMNYGTVTSAQVYLGIYATSACTSGTTKKAIVGTGGGGSNICGTTTLNDGVWHQITATFDGTTWRLYVDGSQEATGTPTTNTTLGTNLRIGLSIADNEGFNGNIDEARIYNRALSPAEVSQLYNFAPGPSGYWRFDDNTGSIAVDSSGNSKTGTLTNSPTWISAGKYGSALTFDGSNDYVSTPQVMPTPLSSPFTMQAWINPASSGAGTWRTAIGTQTSLAQMGITSGNQFACGENGGGATGFFQSLSDTVTYGQWYHLACVYDGANLSIYLNGVLKSGPTARTFGKTAHGVTYFGVYSPTAELWNGQIDEAKIYNYPRTAKQVIEDMNAGHPAPGSPVGSPLLNLKFDEGSVNTCSGGTNDACNSGNQGSTLDGAFSGNTSYTQSGRFGRGAAFDGTTDFVTIPASSAFNFGTGGLTYSVWTEVDSFSINRFILDRTTGTTPLIDLIVTTSATVTCQFRDTAGTLQSVTSTRTLSANTWYHLACVRDTALDKWFVYINGVVDNSATDTTASMDLSAVSLKIGDHADGAGGMLGTLDEFKIYNSALTAEQIKQDMNRGSGLVAGSLSDNSSYDKNAANQEYCVPGDTTSCAAPVGRWDFEEGTGTTANDISGNSNTGTLTLGPTWTTGKLGKAINYDGSNDSTEIGAAKFDGQTTSTMEMWIYYTGSFSSNAVFFSRYKDGSNRMPIFVSASTQKITYENIVAGSNRAIVSNSVITANTWYHLAFTCGTGGMKMYVNGVLQTDTNATTDCFSTIAATTNTSFGAQAGGAGFPGKIDNARIFDYIRTPSQIAWDYNQGKPVAHWKFDECQGTTVNDSAGNSLSGTITVGGSGTQTAVGTCTGSANTMWKDGATGKRNASLDFDGTDDYISVADSALFDLNSYTLSAWVKTSDAGTGRRRIISQQDANYWVLSFENNFLGGCDSKGGTCWQSTAALADGSWHHIAMVRTSGTDIKWYKDGVLVMTQAVTSTVAYAIADAVQIGRYTGGTEYYSGQIDDVKVYNYNMTPTQIKTLMNEGAIRYGPVTGAP